MEIHQQKWAALSMIPGIFAVIYGIMYVNILYPVLYLINCMCSFMYHYKNYTLERYNYEWLRYDLMSQQLSVYTPFVCTISNGLVCISPFLVITNICDLEDSTQCTVALCTHVLSILFISTYTPWYMTVYWLLTFSMYKIPFWWSISFAHMFVHLGIAMMWSYTV